MTLGPRTVNETRAQVAYSNLHAPPTDPIGPALNDPTLAPLYSQPNAYSVPPPYPLPYAVYYYPNGAVILDPYLWLPWGL